MSQPSARPYRMVVGVDFDTPGDDAIAEALHIARERTDAEIHLVHVVKLAGDDARSLDRAADDMERDAQRMRERIADVSAKIFPEERWEQDLVYHVRLGDPATALMQVAVDYEARLIIVGTHARRGLERLLLGSVTQRLIQVARLPVLVARPRDLGAIRKSERPDPPRPGETLSSEHYKVSERARFSGHGRHISGLL